MASWVGHVTDIVALVRKGPQYLGVTPPTLEGHQDPHSSKV